MNIFESNYRRGKFDASRKLSNGGMMEFAKVYPMDAVYDTPEEVPEDVSFRRKSGDLRVDHSVSASFKACMLFCLPRCRAVKYQSCAPCPRWHAGTLC